MKRFLQVFGVFIAIMAVFFGFAIFREFSALSKELQTKVELLELHELNLAGLSDGVYHGQTDWGIIKVQLGVEVRGGRITHINIAEHRNGRGKAAEVIVEQVIEAQSVQIDVVSGATFSSKAILSAVQEAVLGGR